MTPTTLGRAIRIAQNASELLLRQKIHNPDIIEAIESLDSLFNILHGLREEEKEIARFESSFLEDGAEAIDSIDREEEEEREAELEESRTSTISEARAYMQRAADEYREGRFR